MKYTTIIEKDRKSGYVAYAPALKDYVNKAEEDVTIVSQFRLCDGATKKGCPLSIFVEAAYRLPIGCQVR